MPHPDGNAPVSPMPRWPGLGLWNLYFLAKLALAWAGYLNLHVLPNAVLAAALLLPLPGRALPIARQLIAVPIGVMLFYHDTWLPPFSRLLAQPDILDFSAVYLLELLNRFIDWNLVGLFFVSLVAYLLLAQWLRLTTITIAVLLWFGSAGLSSQIIPTPVAARQSPLAASPDNAPVSDALLNAKLESFYRTEAERQVEFPSAAAQDFDLLLLNICSLSWDDLDAVGLRDHALFQRMDLIFDNFNTASSYSGPSAIRLLRANCGQAPHPQLYQSAPAQCLLFENLRKLGFSGDLALNHDGRFGNFLDDLHNQTGLSEPAVEGNSFRRAFVSFDNSPIWRDQEVLGAWWQQRQRSGGQPAALYYNSITLHDGNRIVLADGGTQAADFQSRARLLLDDLDRFVRQLERSGRPVVVIFVPEHGAALHGDRMQISGMREIPSSSITHVPVAVKLIGLEAPELAAPLRIGEPSSYLALSELVARLLATPTFNKDAGFSWGSLLHDLPTTPAVSENGPSVVLEHDGIPYVRLKEKGAWLPYPQRTR